MKSALEDIPGIGPKKRSLLLKHFGSIKKLGEATAEQIASLPRSQKKIQKLF